MAFQLVSKFRIGFEPKCSGVYQYKKNITKLEFEGAKHPLFLALQAAWGFAHQLNRFSRLEGTEKALGDTHTDAGAFYNR